jgi:hypothetical protein
VNDKSRREYLQVIYARYRRADLQEKRPQSPFESARLKLRGLDREARHTVQDVDQAHGTQMTGRELMESGLLVSISERPGAVIISHKRTKPRG